MTGPRGAVPPLLLTDDDVLRRVSAPVAVEAMREAVVAAERGALHAPPRVAAPLGDGRVVFTVGALDGGWFGYRSYDTFDHPAGDQVVVVHDGRDGRVAAIAVGTALGRLRTGALGGLAVDLMADPGAKTLGLVGTGDQAWAQLWAIAAVRDLQRVEVHSRTAARAEAFAARAAEELGLSCAYVGSAEAAVRGKRIVVLATTSPTPVVDASWLDPGSHVTTVGPKQVGAAEFDLDLVDLAALTATDSPSQLHAYDPPSLVSTTEHAEQVVSLGSLAVGARTGRPVDGVTLYLSVGLAGTEAHLLHRLTTGPPAAE